MTVNVDREAHLSILDGKLTLFFKSGSPIGTKSRTINYLASSADIDVFVYNLSVRKAKTSSKSVCIIG